MTLSRITFDEKIRDDNALVMAAEEGDVERIKGLLKDGASINSRDDGGETSLIKTARKGNAALLQFLLKAGVDSNLSGNCRR